MAENTEGTAKKSATVFVGCKFPNGMVLEIGSPEEKETYQRIILNGSSTARIAMVAGDAFGITEVPRPFWDSWHKKYKHVHAMWFREGRLFCADDLASAQAIGVERCAVLTGLEPLRPDDATAKAEGVEPDPKHMQKLAIARNRGDVRASGIRVG